MAENQTTLTRQELWRLQYRNRPYLRNASDDVLVQRLKDVMNNLATLNQDGKIELLPIGPEGIYWMTLFTHLHEEHESRRASPPLLSDMPFPKPTAPRPARSALTIKNKQSKTGQALAKLGKLAHMQALYEAGQIRIAPALSYSDPSLNYAMNDDEMRFDRVMPGSEVTITFLDKQTSELKNVKPIGDVTDTTSLKTNFYVYCMTHRLSHRLFDDFEADACVVFHEPMALIEKLEDSMREALPGWIGRNQEVQYIDPYQHPNKSVDLVFSKHFRFWYQQEYRFSWLPEKCGREHLEPINIELGSLEKISELCCL